MKRKIKNGLKRTGVILMASACAFSMNIAEVFAMENETEATGNSETVQEETFITKNDAVNEAESAGTEESTQPETPEEPTEPEEPTQPEVPEEPTTPEEPETPEEPTDPAEPEIPEEPTQPETPEEPTEPEIPETPQEPATPQEPSTPDKPAVSDSTSGSNTGSTYYKKGNAVNGVWSPAGSNIDDREKIKYNVSVPIEGLPSFITQEMIVGALKCQDETGFPASVTIAQIIQESGFGAYGENGEQGQGLSYLAFQYNNLFGIKGTGSAGSVNMNTGEQTSSGESYRTTAGFRVYNTYTESIEDRTDLLKRVYSDLIAQAKDSDSFATLIGGRWATDISYGQSLIYQMKKYDLYRLDHMTLKQFSEMVGKFANPCPGSEQTSDFGYRTFDNSFHKGLDLGTGKYNLPTYAAEAGTVITAGWSDSAGNWVVIDHGNGLITKYMHHDKIYVQAGQHVEKGQQIGLSGTTGYSTGNHLHFQIEENGTAVDPSIYLGL